MSCPDSVKASHSTERCSVARATPKSITLGTGFPSTSVTSKFEGLTSPWMMPFLCACCSALQTGMNNCRRSRVLNVFKSQYWVMGSR
jgi:hypothetical protein